MWDYIPRPSKAKLLIPLIVSVLRYENDKLAEESRSSLPSKQFEGIHANSLQMKACLKLVANAARSDEAVLIKGEVGVGKELIASAIHKNSLRAENKFVVVECAAFKGVRKLPDEIVEQAYGGTLFLDKVEELPVAVQKSLWSMIRRQRSRRTEYNRDSQRDFRLIASTMKDLSEMAHKRKFNEDLLFHVRSFMIEIPPLRKRREDIKSIVGYHVIKICERLEIESKEFSPEFLEALQKYDWPGNVRELVNTLEGAVIAARGELTLLPWHLPLHIRIHLARTAVNENTARRTMSAQALFEKSQGFPALDVVRNAAMEKAEGDYLRQLMNAVRGNIERACRISNLSPSRLYALLKKYRKEYFATEMVKNAE